MLHCVVLLLLSTFGGNVSFRLPQRQLILSPLKASLSDEGRFKSVNSNQIPRLDTDLFGLISFIEKSGGSFEPRVVEYAEGWALSSRRNVIKGEVLLSIPKSICIRSDPSASDLSLQISAKNLMDLFDKKQWRARLAIALLSERVKPNSLFRAYIQNLPFEYWGMPMFFSTSEFRYLFQCICLKSFVYHHAMFSDIQDLALMHKTQDRCRFLSEFADQVLKPLQKTSKDPFSGFSAGADAFGWGFATACSRAIRFPDSNPVMIPGIELAKHSFSPNCEVLDDDTTYYLVSSKDISADAELTISYGSLSNEELLMDYGFTVDNNPFDSVMINCDAHMLNTARTCTGQSSGLDEDKVISPQSWVPTPSTSSTSPGATSTLRIGRGSENYHELWLSQWQLQWLRALNLYGPTANFAMRIGGPTIDKIDGRLWAFLRIIYSQSEEELLSHGYDPFLLQEPGSIVSTKVEAQVVKTLVGIVGVILSMFKTDLDADLIELVSDQPLEAGSHPHHSSLSNDGPTVASSRTDIVTGVQKLLRGLFGVPEPPPPLPKSPTLRRMMGLGLGLAAGSGTATTMSTPTSSPSYSPPLNHPSDAPPRPSVEETILRKSGLRASSDSTRDGAAVDGSIEGTSQVVGATTGSSPGVVAEVVLESPIKNDHWEKILSEDVSMLGLQQHINRREALRFRIRKKRLLYRLTINLGEYFKVRCVI